jgi:hypothetical protein
LNAALEGHLDEAPMYVDPVFGFQVLKEVQGVPREILETMTNRPSNWPASLTRISNSTGITARQLLSGRGWLRAGPSRPLAISILIP